MPGPITSVPFSIKPDGYSESGNYQSVSGTVIYETAWADRYTFINDAIGPTGPWQHPIFPNAKSREFKISGGGKPKHDTGSGANVGFEFALIEITYKTDDKDGGSSGGGVEESLKVKIGSQYVSVDKENVKWASGDQFEGNPGFPMPTIDVDFTKDGLLTFDPSTLEPFVGGVNDTVWKGFSRGHVLFEGVDCERTGKAGNKVWSVSYKFKARREEWNKFYRPKTNSWEYTNPKFLPYKSFSGLGV